MAKILKRLGSLAMALLLVASLLPLQVFAADGDVTWTEVDTLEELTAALAAGGYIKLAGPITATAQLTTGAAATIDFNGNTLSLANVQYPFYITKTMVFEDNSTSAVGGVKGTGASIQQMIRVGGGSLTVNSGHYVLDNTSSSAARTIYSWVPTTINGGTISAKNSGTAEATAIQYATTGTQTLTLTVNGGTISATSASGEAYGIRMNYSTVTVLKIPDSGNTVTITAHSEGGNAYGIRNLSTAVLENPKLTVTGTSANSTTTNKYTRAVRNENQITISAGTYTGKSLGTGSVYAYGFQNSRQTVGSAYLNGSATITGGSFCGEAGAKGFGMNMDYSDVVDIGGTTVTKGTAAALQPWRGTINVTGGTHYGPEAFNKGSSCTLTVTGGTFNGPDGDGLQDIFNYLGEDYAQDSNGTVKSAAEAGYWMTVDGTGYYSPREAFAAIKEDGTSELKLLRDYDYYYSGTFATTAAFTLDLGGHTWRQNRAGGNGINIDPASGTGTNTHTVIKNGEISNVNSILLRFTSGTFEVDNITGHGYIVVGYYVTDGTAYDQTKNKITNSVLYTDYATNGGYTFSFHNSTAQTGVAVSIDNSVLMNTHASEGAVFRASKTGTSGTINLGENVHMYGNRNQLTSIVTGASLSIYNNGTAMNNGTFTNVGGSGGHSYGDYSNLNLVYSTHGEEVEVPAVPHTCTEDGLLAGTKCKVCGLVMKAQETDPAAHDTIVKVDGKAPTCVEAGWNDYYQCSICEEYFADSLGETIIGGETQLEGWKLSDGAIKATGDHASHATATAAVAASCTEDGNIAYWQCDVCKKYFSDAACTTEILESETLINKNGHSFVSGTCTVCGESACLNGHTWGDKVEAKTANCAEGGWAAHYVCQECGSYGDENMADIAYDALLTDVEPGNHADLAHTEAVAATVYGPGHEEYWYCSGCHSYYADAAAENKIDGPVEIAQLTAVAQIGETDKFATLQEAVNAAVEGDTIVVLVDHSITGTVTVAAGKNLTIDLNGKTVTGGSANVIENSGTLTITGDGTINATGGYMILNAANATLTVESGTFEINCANTINNAFYAIIRNEGGTVTVNDGTYTVIANENSTSGVYLYPALNTSGTMTINDGTFSSSYNYAGAVAGRAFSVGANGGELTINGGSFSGYTKATSSNSRAGAHFFGTAIVNIKGGTLNANKATTAAGQIYAIRTENTAKVYITGGTINGSGGSFNTNASSQVHISGGTINNRTWLNSGSWMYVKGGTFNAGAARIFEGEVINGDETVEITADKARVVITDGTFHLGYGDGLVAVLARDGTSGTASNASTYRDIPDLSVLYPNAAATVTNGNHLVIASTVDKMTAGVNAIGADGNAVVTLLKDVTDSGANYFQYSFELDMGGWTWIQTAGVSMEVQKTATGTTYVHDGKIYNKGSSGAIYIRGGSMHLDGLTVYTAAAMPVCYYVATGTEEWNANNLVENSTLITNRYYVFSYRSTSSQKNVEMTFENTDLISLYHLDGGDDIFYNGASATTGKYILGENVNMYVIREEALIKNNAANTTLEGTVHDRLAAANYEHINTILADVGEKLDYTTEGQVVYTDGTNTAIDALWESTPMLYKWTTNHTYEYVSDGNATCTEDGTMTEQCTATIDGTACGLATGATKTEEGSTKGHTYGEPEWTWADDKSSATATFTCTVCEEGTEGHTCTVDATVSSDVTSAPTCTGEGEVTFTATVTFQEETYTDGATGTVTATGHAPAATNQKNATCTEAGHKAYWYCDACKTYFSDAEATAKIDDIDTWLAEGGAGYLAPLDHTYAEAEAQGWTSSGDGTHYMDCDRCGEAGRKNENCADHAVTDAAKAAGCETTGLTEGSHCEICNYVIKAQEETSVLGHNMQETTAQVDATCETAGTTAVLTCANGCGKTEGGETIPASGHTAGETNWDADMHWIVCGVCGEPYEEATHAFTEKGDSYEATFDSDAFTLYYCVCGSKNEVYQEGTKLTVGAFIDTNSNGTYDEGESRYQTMAEAIEAVGNSYTVVVMQDVVLTEKLTISKEVYLNLNGYKITGDVSDSYGMIYVGTKGALNVSNGTITNTAGYAIGNYGWVCISNVDVTGAENYAALYNFYYNGTTYGRAKIDTDSTLNTVWNCGWLDLENCTVSFLDNSGYVCVTAEAIVTASYLRDGSDAPDVAEGAGTVEITDPTALNATLPEGYELKNNGDGTYTVTEVVKNYVAQIGETKYTDLQEAVDAADGQTVTLLADITAESMIKIEGENLTLDLNGHVITAAEDVLYVVYVTTGDELTIVDSGENGGIVNNNTYGYAVLNQGTLTIEDGSFTGDGAVWNGYNTIDAKAYLNGGTYTANSTGTLTVGNSGTMVVDGANISGYVQTYGAFELVSGEIEYLDVWTPTANATAATVGTTISGGTIGTLEVVSQSNASAANGVAVTGGTVNALDIYYDSDATIINEIAVSGGTVSAMAAYQDWETETTDLKGLVVSGGTFGEPVPEDNCAEGFVPTDDGNGNYGVEEGAYVAQVGETKYETLEAAFAAAQAGDTVKLITDVTIEGGASNGAFQIAAGRTLTLDLNGYDITASARTGYTGRTQYAFDNYADLTIVNSGSEESVITSRGIQNYGTLTINDSDIKVVACDTNGGAAVWNYGTLNIGAGTFTTAAVGSASAIANDGNSADAVTTITGGTFYSNGTNIFTITNNNGTTTISNATVTGTHGTVAASKGTVTIESGTFTLLGNAGHTDSVVYAEGSANLTVNGGTFDASNTASESGRMIGAYSSNIVTVNGGSFTSNGWFDVADCDADSLVINQGATFADIGESDVTATNQYCEEGFELTANEEGVYGLTEVQKLSGTVNGCFIMNPTGSSYITTAINNVYAEESIVLKLFDAEGNLLATSTLVDNDRVLLGKELSEVSGTILIAAQDDWWNTVWEEGKCHEDYVPATITLYVDGVEMNSTPALIRDHVELPLNWADVNGVEKAPRVAQVGDTQYRTLAEAIAAAEAGQTVTLLDNVTCASGEIIDLTGLTLDLNGKTLYTGKLTGILVGDNFTVTNGTVDGQGASYGLWIGDTTAATNVTIDGVTVIGGINVFNSSNVTLKNNTVSGKTYYAVWADEGVEDLVIESGTYNGAEGKAAVLTTVSEIIVSGGTFSTAIPEEYCAEGYIPTANDDGTYGVKVGAYVAQIGNTKYESLDEAIAAVKDGETVTLLTDVTVSGVANAVSITGDVSFTLDFGGHTLTANTTNSAVRININNDNVNKNVEITLKNGTIAAGSSAYCAVIAAGKSEDVALTVNIEDMTMTNCHNYGFNVKAFAYATVNVKDGTKIVSNDGQGGVYALADAEINIYEGAEIVQQNTATTYMGANIGVSGTGIVNVYGGTFTSDKYNANVMSSGGTLNISGGTFTSTSYGIKVDSWDSGVAGPSVANITGGTFTAPNVIWVGANEGEQYSAAANISGGTFNGKLDATYGGENSSIAVSAGTFDAVVAKEYCAEGYVPVTEADENGMYTVKEATYVAQVGDKKYETVLEAVAAAIESSASEVKVLTSVKEVLPTDVEWILNADLTITADEAVTVEFYNDGTSYDLIFNSASSAKTLTIAENVTIDVTDRVIWMGYYGNDVDIVVNGTLAAYQIWHGADTTVNATGKLESHGEALVMRRGATLTIDGGTVDANYFNILQGNIVAENATITSGSVWIPGSYGHSSVLLDEGTTWTSTGNLQMGDAELYLYTGSTMSVALHDGVMSKIDAAAAIYAWGGTLNMKKTELNGTLEVDQYSAVTIDTLVGSGTVNLDATDWNGTEKTMVTTNAADFAGTVAVINDETGDAIAEITDSAIVMKYKAVASVTDAEGNVTNYKSLDAALAAAQDGDTVTLLWAEGDEPIAMNGAVYGKTVTITGTATVDWSKGYLFIGRGGEGNGTVIFDGANLTSASNTAAYGIHVSGREKDTTNKYDGTLVIKNSTIELDYLINKGTMSLDNSTLTVKNGFSIGGRPASETESGEDATATLSLANGSKVIVNNHNGMGLGYEAIGVMNIDATSSFETTQSFLVTAKGTMNLAGTATIAGTLTNNGSIVLTDADATLTGSECGNVTTTVDNYETAYVDGAYIVQAQLPEVEITDIKDSLTDADPDLTFALNFKIKDMENLSEEYLEDLFNTYGSHYVDYVLTIEGLTDESVTFNANGNANGYLAGQYDAWSENWVSVPFEDVTMVNGESLYIMEYAAKLMGQSGLRFTLAEVAQIVQNFDCGVYFTPEFLEANPNMVVTLELKVFTEDAEGNKIEDMSVATNTFENEYEAVVVDTNKQSHYFVSFEDAMAAAEAGETVILLENVTIDEMIKIEKAITLDLFGNTVTATSKKAFEVYADATIQNGTIEAANRAVDTRTAVTLNLTDVTLIADEYISAYGNPQPLTIGGSVGGTVVNMTNVTIDAGTTGYGIITFVETELNAANSNVSGYSALYVKPGSEGSAFTFTDSTLSSDISGNDVAGNAFATIAIQTSDVFVTMNGGKLETIGQNQNSIGLGASSIAVTGNTVTINSTIEGNLLYAKELTGNTVTVPAAYADQLIAEGYSYVSNGDGTVTAMDQVDLPEVEITDIKDTLTDSDPDLTFALNFKIKDAENLSEEYLEALFNTYGSHYVDYVLTIEGLTDESVTFNANGNANGYLAGQYDAWSENWVSVPFEDVTMANGESLYIMEYAAKLMGQSGLRFTLAEVAQIVQNFDCGVYFTPEFLEANPNMVVTLELKVFTEDENGTKIEDMSVATNTFENEYEAVVVDTNKQSHYFATVEEAVAAAEAGETVILLADAECESAVVIDKAITLDGFGNTLTSTATRAINVDCDGAVEIKNLTIDCGANTERAVNIIQKPATVTLTNVTVPYAKYAVNVANSAGAATVNIADSDITGYAALNITAAGVTANVENTKLTGVGVEGETNSFATIAVQDNAGVTVNVTGGEINATGTQQFMIGVNNGAENATFVLDTTLNYADAGIVGAVVDGNSIAVRAEYAEQIIAEGFLYETSAIEGLIDLTGKAAASVNGINYSELQDAIDAAEELGTATVIVLDNLELTSHIVISEGITLDLNGYSVVTTKTFTVYGDVIDGTEGGYGMISGSKVHIMGTHSFLSIYDSTVGGYRFYAYEVTNLGARDQGNGVVKFGTRLLLTNKDGYTVLANTTDAKLKLHLYITWDSLGNEIDYVFQDATVKSFAQQAAAQETVTVALVLTVNGADKIPEGESLTVRPEFASESKIVAVGSEASWANA